MNISKGLMGLAYTGNIKSFKKKKYESIIDNCDYAVCELVLDVNGRDVVFNEINLQIGMYEFLYLANGTVTIHTESIGSCFDSIVYAVNNGNEKVLDFPFDQQILDLEKMVNSKRFIVEHLLCAVIISIFFSLFISSIYISIVLGALFPFISFFAELYSINILKKSDITLFGKARVKIYEIKYSERTV